jgi:hypothetical protein
MTHFLIFDIELGPVIEIGMTPLGQRRMVPLLGGTVRGEFSGKVLPGGSDWQILRPDGTLEINARYIIETVEAERIEVQSAGMRVCDDDTRRKLEGGGQVSPDAYYFRTAVRLFTGAPRLLHLNDRLFSCRGERFSQAVRLFISPVA